MLKSFPLNGLIRLVAHIYQQCSLPFSTMWKTHEDKKNAMTEKDRCDTHDNAMRIAPDELVLYRIISDNLLD